MNSEFKAAWDRIKQVSSGQNAGLVYNTRYYADVEYGIASDYKTIATGLTDPTRLTDLTDEQKRAEGFEKSVDGKRSHSENYRIWLSAAGEVEISNIVLPWIKTLGQLRGLIMAIGDDQ